MNSVCYIDPCYAVAFNLRECWFLENGRNRDSKWGEGLEDRHPVKPKSNTSRWSPEQASPQAGHPPPTLSQFTVHSSVKPHQTSPCAIPKMYLGMALKTSTECKSIQRKYMTNYNNEWLQNKQIQESFDPFTEILIKHKDTRPVAHEAQMLIFFFFFFCYGIQSASFLLKDSLVPRPLRKSEGNAHGKGISKHFEQMVLFLWMKQSAK